MRKNRFFKQTGGRLAGAILLALCTMTGLRAQSGFFNFSPPVPNTRSVGPLCSATFQTAPTPTVTSAVGATITVSQFDPVNSGFSITDGFVAPATVLAYWYVEDDQGHSFSFPYTIQFVDATAPIFNTVGIDNPLVLASVVQLTPPPNVPVSDNCTPTPQIVVTYSESGTIPDTCEQGTFFRTWIAEDLAGNTSVFTQSVVIYKDSIQPVITVAPVNGSAPCELLPGAWNNWLSTQMANFTATDGSGIKAYWNNAPASFPAGCPAPITVTFRVTDNCNFIRLTTATFSTFDNEAPYVATAPQTKVTFCKPANTYAAELAQWISNRAGSVVQDSCTPDNMLVHKMYIGGVEQDSAQITAAFLSSLNNACATQIIDAQTFDRVRGSVLVEFRTTDACGQTTSAGDVAFILRDTLAPVISGNNITEECGGGDDQSDLQAWINAQGNATFTDDCTQASWTNFSWLTSTGNSGSGSFGAGPYPAIQANSCNWFVDVTFRATDGCGNTGAKTLRFSITDLTPPSISGFNPVVTIYCPNQEPAVPTASTSDNCDANVSLTFTKTILNQSCAGIYDVRVDWLATDDCGNTSTAIQTFQVRDTSGPVFTLVPAALTFRCDTFVLPPVPVQNIDISADDACGAVLSITTQTVSNQNPDPNLCSHYTYTILRTFTATDDCGRTRTATQVITVIDNQAPVLSGLADTTLLCSAPLLVPAPVGSDACGSPVSAAIVSSEVILAGVCANSDTIRRVWTAQDVCGNPGTFVQNIIRIDTVAPILTNVPADITVQCLSIPAPPALASMTGTDNCDNSVAFSFTETILNDPDPNNCEHWSDYFIRREWTAVDNCGNTRKGTQMIYVDDVVPPQIQTPVLSSVPNTPGLCGVNFNIPAPLSVLDDCSAGSASVILRDTAALENAVNITGLPVDTVVFQWTPPNNLPLNPVIGNPSLSIFLDNADANDPTEFFYILDENNQLMGTTALAPSQCGNSAKILSLSATALNQWMADGVLTLRLAPNGTGSAAVNPVCPGRRARAALTYSYRTEGGSVAVEYRIDNGPFQPYAGNPSTFLSTGAHTLTYRASDCRGNSSTAAFNFTVIDNEKPVFAGIASQTAYVGNSNCIADFALPFPNLSDNCAFTGNVSAVSAVIPIRFEYDPDVDTVPQATVLPLAGLIPNAVGNGVLRIRHWGENNESGEFFSVQDEGNLPVGNTAINSGGTDCTALFESLIPVTAAQINAWAANGSATFTATANRDLGIFSTFINNCGSLDGSGYDGESTLQAILEYNYANISYAITKNSVPVASGSLSGAQTQVALPPGVYTVTYQASDNSGNIGQTNFQLTVRDTIKPIAKCNTRTIFTSPSGLQNYTLTPAEINNNSSDNCTPAANLSFSLSQTTFTCNQAPNNYPIILTVTDSSGNTGQCTALIKVEISAPMPTYTPVCEGGVLELMANPPDNPGPNIYAYAWSGPNMWSNNQENPTLANAQNINEGTYTVRLTGFTGCTATGAVTVDLLNLPGAPVLNINSVSGQYCAGQSVVLSTDTYNGQNVSYTWYLGLPGSEIFLANTSAPQYTLNNLSPGTYQYFVVVSGNNCTSINSNIRTVQVNALPVAVVENDQIVVCEGELIRLGSPVPGLQYQWSGPSSFNNNQQYPLVTNAAVKSQHEGVYFLRVTQNGCTSAPVPVQVTVKTKPAQPQISGLSAVCVGNSVTLTAGNIGAGTFTWQSPNMTRDTVTYTANYIQLNNLQLSDNGNWVVRVEQAGCSSDASLPFSISVQSYPLVSAPPLLRVCEGDTLKLSANADLPAASLTWCWTGPNTYNDCVQNPVVLNPTAGNYQVTATSSNGCSGTASVNVLVIAPPKIDTITHNAPVCAPGNTSVTLVPSITSLNTPFMYTWTGPQGFMSTLLSPVVSNFNESKSGPYNLRVKDAFGCVSLQKTVEVNTQDVPVSPVINTPLPVCIGEPVNLIVGNSNQYSGNVTYTWVRGSNEFQTTQPNFFIAALNSQFAGQWTVQVLEDNCLSPVSASVNVVLKPQPNQPIASANSPVCAGETIQFQLNNPQGSYTYFWKKTDGTWSSTGATPTIPDATTAFSGTYLVESELDGCRSQPSEPITVVVKPRPQTPFAQPTLAVCKQQPDTLSLSFTQGTSGATYQWFNAQTNLPISPAISASPYETSALTGLASGVNTFYVVATLNGCKSNPSNNIGVQVDTVPSNSALTDLDFNACVTNPFMINAVLPSVGTALWTQVAGAPTTISNPDSNSTFVSGALAGQVYRYRWSLSNGACVNYSSDEIAVTVVSPEAAIAGPNDTLCFSNSLPLSATQGLYSNGSWSQPTSQTALNIQIQNPNNPNATAVNIPNNGGSFLFFWSLANIGCGVSTDTLWITTYNTDAFAGNDQTLCGNDSCAALQALPLGSHERGEWFSANPNAFITNPFSPATSVCDLNSGPNVFYWVKNDGECGNRSRDTVIITYNVEPSLKADTLRLSFGAKGSINALLNDQLPSQYKLTVIDPPKHSSIFRELATGIFEYQPATGFSGVDQLVYEICNVQCPDASNCVRQNVFFFTESPDDCLIPSIITPNGDPLNETFKISCLEGDGAIESEVIIFNQWGDQVFHAKPYNNNWDGRYKGQLLPAGTYYYVVRINEAAAVRTGFLIIQR